MSNNSERPSILAVLNRVFTPLRIISVVSFLSLLSIPIPYGTAQFFFYGFFLFVIASYVIEYLHHRRHRTSTSGLILKYLTIIPFEYIGVYVLTMSTLPFPNREQIHVLEINVSVMVSGVVIMGEILHYVLFSTEIIQLNLRKILAIIVGSVISVYDGIFMELFVLANNSHAGS